MNAPDINVQSKFYDERWCNVKYINRPKLIRSVHILKAIYDNKIVYPRILELGCGTGWLASMLGNIGPTTGIELSPVAIEKAKSRFPDVEFICADITQVHEWHQQFNIVVSHEVIEHLNDQIQHLSLAHKVLDKGGILILTTPNHRMFTKFAVPKAEDLQPIENWLTAPQLKNLAHSVGFQVVSLSSIRPGPFTKVIAYDTLRSALKMFRLNRMLDLLLCHLCLGYQLFMVAKKNT
jgi:2-polyprenyl-3-methyl-5-hydroxy-6-metoxy-1,4-benzoquinol methylase